MSMVGTFDSFTSARLGIYAAQHGLRTTGNNISNINTSGYTRQRVDQYSMKVGTNDMYRSLYDNHVGSGALIKGISQIRDPYLDIRYRNASTETYHYDTWLAGLQNIASILDEVGKGANGGDGMLYAQLQDLAEKLRSYGANPTGLNDRLVRNSATSLTSLFHSVADRLERLYNETKMEFTENISAVNEILTNIRDLNKSIRESEIHGDTALEMRDERNRQIDALSQYLDIKVQYSYEDIGAGIQVEKLTIKLGNANPDPKVDTDESVLVDGVYATQLSVPDEKPVLNMYDKDSDCAYLNKYLYTRQVSVDDQDAIDAFLKDNPNLTQADLDKTKVTDKDGNEYYLIGTNDSDLPGVVTEENDNLTIQLSKLLNAKGAEWKNTTTRWTDVKGEPVSYYTWAYTVNSELGAGDKFKIGEITYTIVNELTDDTVDTEDNKYVLLTDIDTNKEFAEFVAARLEESERYKGQYTVTSDGDKIVFTATDPENTAKPPLTVDPPDAGIDLTAPEDHGTTIKYKLPDEITLNTPEYTYDEHGKVIQSVTYVQGGDGRYYRVQIDTEYTHEITLDDNDLRGILQAEREMLTEEGEFAGEKDLAIDENALIKRGIPYYMKSLDLLAQKFAEAYNKLNSGYAYNQKGNYIKEDGTELTLWDAEKKENLPVSATDGLTPGQRQNLLNYGYYLKDEKGNPVDEKGNPITDEKGNPITVGDDGKLSPDDYDKVVVDLNRWLDKKDAYFMGGPLFSNRGDGNDTTKITAANISIAADWSNGVYGVIPTFMMLFADDGSGGLTHSTQSDNASHMIAMIENSLTYDPRDLFGSDAIGPVLFEGSFNDMLGNMMAVQGEDADITGLRLTDYATTLNEIDFSREGVSGVDLNDEAMNMITYQKAMSAAMRLMTVIDSMLDRLINNTGITV